MTAVTETAHQLILAAVDSATCTDGGPARGGIVEMARRVHDAHGPDALVDLAAVLACVAAEGLESYCRLQGADEDELSGAVAEWLDATS